MKRAFTLVELMMTVGLMALLGTLSTVGYFAASRGMKDSGVRQSVISLLRLAQQRALIDNKPVVVFLYNQTLQEGDNGDLGDVKSDASMGAAVVVRMAGRISYIRSGYICDEFADWNEYPTSSSSSGNAQMRIYKIPGQQNAKIGDCRSFVSDYVTAVGSGTTEYLLAMSEQIYGSVKGMSGSDSDLAILNSFGDDFGQKGFPSLNPPYGFEVKGGFTGWAVGDAYGFEIASLQLPNGYTFNKKAPNSVGVEDVETYVFNPADVAPNTASFSRPSVSIQIKAVGTGNSSELRNVGKAIGNSDLKDK